MHLRPQRYSRVPWLWPVDLEEGARATWEVEHRVNKDRVSCWQVPIYEPEKSTCGYLLLHAVRGRGNDGGEISLAISMTPRYDVYAKDVLAVAPQMTSQRASRYVYRSQWELE